MPRLRHDQVGPAVALLAALVPSVVAVALLWTQPLELKTRVTLTLAIAVSVAVMAGHARSRVSRPVQTLANLIAAVREGDYAVRGRARADDDSLGLAHAELAALADELRATRHRELEAAAGLPRIVEALDVVVFAVDPKGTVRLANRATGQLVALREPVGRTVDELGLAALVEGAPRRTIRLELPGATGAFELLRSEVRLSGVPHRLVVLTDVQRALRTEERLAWQRLVRVLGHEINNSLSPIHSIAGTLRLAAARRPSPPDLAVDLEQGLAIIERRSEALARFMASYARLARLPPPRLSPVDVEGWIRRAAELESRVAVELLGGPRVTLWGDADQLEQLLINLVANAAEAATETGGGVRLWWTASGREVQVMVEDDGPGLADTANLFVPFFTTKPAGSGIGLPLARQIAEGHGGRLTLINRSGARGCCASVILPVRPPAGLASV